ncbi:MAG TPA: hypothetical protein VGE21_14630, partial [Flavobacteriales bacterium]
MNATPARICFVLLVSFLTIAAQAQFEVFRTVDDLLNKTPQTYPGFDFASQKGMKENTKVVLKNDGKEEVVIDCAAIWGFSYKGKLFRVIRAGKYYDASGPQYMPVMLGSEKSGVYYWINTPFMLNWTRKDQKGVLIHKGTPFMAMLSVGVDGDVVPVTYNGKGPKWIEGATERFLKDNPTTDWLWGCSRLAPLKKTIF